jgi:hypothetical protein
MVVLATPGIRLSKQRLAEIANLRMASSTCVSQGT